MAMTGGDGAGNLIAPDPALIETFSKVLFRYCDGWVAVREFSEKGTANRPPRLPFLRADADLGVKLVAEATEAAKAGLALYVIPGTVSGQGKAKADDVVAMQTVLVDLDHGDVRSKRDHLAEHLGPPSLEVVSGGITEQGQEKLHLYWNLTEPAIGTDNEVNYLWVTERTLQPRVQILRRYHRPLLLRLELLVDQPWKIMSIARRVTLQSNTQQSG